MELVGLILVNNEMWEENIEKITKSDSNFAPIFVDYQLLPDILMDTV